jgi:uncharacterized membrane protein YcaP (DUF421 family)
MYVLHINVSVLIAIFPFTTQGRRHLAEVPAATFIIKIAIGKG